MGDTAGGPSSGSNRSTNNVSLKSGKMAAIRAKPKIKPTTGRNLLPSKLVVGSTSGTMGMSKPRSVMPVKPRQPATTPTAQKSLSDDLDNANDAFLQSFLLDAYVEELKDLQQLEQGNTLVMKHVEAAALDPKMGKVYADKLVLNCYENVMLVNKFENVFDDLFGFTGDETLVEIQSILAKKYDRILVEGTTMKHPIFEENVVENIVAKLKTTFQEQENEDTVMGFSFMFAEALNNLAEKTEFIEMRNSELQVSNKLLLENCSLSICSKAQLTNCNE